MANNIVKFWRGKRETYNLLVQQGKADYWTRYSIIEPDGTVTESFGSQRLISEPTGQLLPVVSVVETLDDIVNPINGERYLVGFSASEEHELAEFNIYTLYVGDNGIEEDKSKKDPFTRGMSVRVIDRYMKCYQLVEGQLVTYDDVDCGTF